MTGTATPSRSERSRLNLALIEAHRALRQLGLSEVVDVTTAMAAADVSIPPVLVVGETQRGKSSLVNALIGAPGLCPVGLPDASPVYVTVRDLRDRDRPSATLHLADGSSREIEFAQVADHVAAGRTADNLPIVSVDVLLRSATPRVELVDTPGIGGVGGVQGELNRRLVARGGGMLVLVVDAGAPMARSELAHLEACVHAVDRVVVVVSMIDKYPATATQIVQHVRDQLASRSARLAKIPVFGVSATLAQACAALPEGEARDALWQASGVPRLSALIERMYGDRETLPARNALQAARHALTGAIESIDARRRLVATDDEELLALEREIARLTDEATTHNETADRWALDFDRNLGRLRRDIGGEIERRLNAYGQSARTRISAIPLTPGRARHVERLISELTAEYALLIADVEAMLVSGIERVVTTAAGEAAEAIVPTLGRSDGSFSLDLELSRRGRLGEMIDPTMMLGVFTGGRIGVGLGAMGAGLGPVGMVLGAAGWVVLQVAFRGQRLDRAELAQEIRDVLAEQRGHLMRLVDEQLSEVKHETLITVRRQLKERSTMLSSALTQARRAKQAGEQRAGEQAAERGRQRTAVRDAVRAIDDALADAGK